MKGKEMFNFKVEPVKEGVFPFFYHRHTGCTSLVRPPSNRHDYVRLRIINREDEPISFTASLNGNLIYHVDRHDNETQEWRIHARSNRILRFRLPEGVSGACELVILAAKESLLRVVTIRLLELGRLDDAIQALLMQKETKRIPDHLWESGIWRDP